MTNHARFVRAALAFLVVGGGLSSLQAANILIVAGTTGLAQTAATVLSTDLSGTNTVTVVNTGVPGSLAGYTQIYDTRFDNNPAFTNGEMTQYINFLNAAPGNAVVLIGENVGFNTRNIPINQFISLAGGGGVSTPATTSTASEVVNPGLRTPNNITTVAFAACGVAVISGSGRYGSAEPSTGGCSLLYGQGSLSAALTGVVAVVYDVNFITSAPNGGAVNEIPFRQNLEQFAAAAPSAPSLLPIPSTIFLSIIGLAILFGCYRWGFADSRA